MQVKLMSKETQVREVRDRGTATRSGVCAVSRGQTRQDLEGELKIEGAKDNCRLVGVWRLWRGSEPGRKIFSGY